MKCVSPLAGGKGTGEVPEICHSDTQTGPNKRPQWVTWAAWGSRGSGSFLHMQIMLLRTCITHLLTIAAAIAVCV